MLISLLKRVASSSSSSYTAAGLGSSSHRLRLISAHQCYVPNVKILPWNKNKHFFLLLSPTRLVVATIPSNYRSIKPPPHPSTSVFYFILFFSFWWFAYDRKPLKWRSLYFSTCWRPLLSSKENACRLHVNQIDRRMIEWAEGGRAKKPKRKKICQCPTGRVPDLSLFGVRAACQVVVVSFICKCSIGIVPVVERF